LALVISAGSVSAQNDALQKKGKTLWHTRGCDGCHGIGRRQAAPDLAGVTQRRSKEWLVRWLKDTQGMLASDSVAQSLLQEYKGIKMPAQKLSSQDIDAILAYVDGQTAKKAN